MAQQKTPTLTEKNEKTTDQKDSPTVSKKNEKTTVAKDLQTVAFQFTDEDFEYFTRRVNEFAKLFNLNHIQIRTTMIDNPEVHELAKFHYDPENQTAIIGLNKSHSNDYSKDKLYILDKAAVHETFEILLNILGNMAVQFCSPKRVYEEIHKVVNVVSNILIDQRLYPNLPYDFTPTPQPE